MKRILSVILSVCILLLVSTSFASAATLPDSKDAVSNLINAINSKDWNTYANLQTATNKVTFQGFINNPENEKNQIGLFNISSAKLKEIKLLSWGSYSIRVMY